MIRKTLTLTLFLLSALFIMSWEKDQASPDQNPTANEPSFEHAETFNFARDGAPTVDLTVSSLIII